MLSICARARRTAMRGSVVLCLVAGAAVAATDSVTIKVVGEVAGSCEISGLTSNLDLGDLGAASSAATSFTLSCNAPYTYDVSSSNGALQLMDSVSSTGSFATTHPYAIDVNAPTDLGALGVSCGSAAMATTNGCAGTSSGGVSLNAAAMLTVTWDPSAARQGAATPLIAGTYQDTVTLTFTVQP